MALLLWPERKRCYACRRYLAALWVVDLLYCSYECSGRFDMRAGLQPGEAPRSCKVYRRGRWRWKHAYPSAEAAEQANPNMVVYQCGFCSDWHLATPKKGKT